MVTIFFFLKKQIDVKSFRYIFGFFFLQNKYVKITRVSESLRYVIKNNI